MYFIILIVFVYFLMRKYYEDKHSYWRQLNIPYVKPRLPFGNLQNFLIGHCSPVGIQLGNLYKRFKLKGHSFGGVYFLHSPVFLPIDSDLIRNILTRDFDYFDRKNVFINENTQSISASLFCIGGEKWNSMRMKICPNFTAAKIKRMLPIILECRQPLLNHLDDVCCKGMQLNVKDIAANFSRDVIGSVAFGIECDSFADPNNKLHRICNKLFHESELQFAKNVIATNFSCLAKNLHLGPFPGDAEKLITAIIRDTVRERIKKKVTKHDFLQLLMKLHSSKTITFNELVAQAFGIFLAGYENTSIALIFCLFELAQHQDIQDRVREEIRQMMATSNNSITFDGLTELSYMQQIIAETLRLHPPIMAIERMCSKPYKLHNNNVVIPAGTSVMIATYGIHHDPDYYEDPMTFNPERFSEENVENIKPFTYLPFGEGPRTCLGQRFVIMQLKVGLTTLLQNYRYTLSNNTSVALNYEFKTVLSPSGNIFLDVEQVD